MILVGYNDYKNLGRIEEISDVDEKSKENKFTEKVNEDVKEGENIDKESLNKSEIMISNNGSKKKLNNIDEEVKEINNQENKEVKENKEEENNNEDEDQDINYEEEIEETQNDIIVDGI